VSIGATAISGNVGKQQQVLPQQQQQLLLLSHPQQQELLLWSDEKRSTEPLQDNANSLIDLDPENTLLANLDPLASSTSVFPIAGGQQFRPSFSSDIPRIDPFASSIDSRFNSPAMPTAPVYAAYPSGGMVPQHWMPYGCAQQAARPSSAVPYSPLRMLTPQYCGIVAHGKTGSNNDLLMLQVGTDIS